MTKVVCGARNRGKLEKAIEKAKELGMIEGVDYFPIVDACESIEARTPQYQNAGVAEYVCGVGDKELREAMLDRINFMLSIAEEHGVQTLILGAWGCGVFEWNPEIVAELFMEIKGKYNIRRSWVI